MAYKYLQPYKRAEHFIDYSGVDRAQYYVAIGRHRDSNLLENHNFEVFESELRKIQDYESEDGWMIMRSKHWAVGWYEEIYIHAENEKLCLAAEDLLSGLDFYPILDEDEYSTKVWEEMQRIWKDVLYHPDRVELCKKYGVDGRKAHGLSIPENNGIEEYIRNLAEG